MRTAARLSRYFASGRLTRNVSTPCESKPGSTLAGGRSCASASPAPESSTSASATSPVTSTLRTRCAGSPWNCRGRLRAATSANRRAPFAARGRVRRGCPVRMPMAAVTPHRAQIERDLGGARQNAGVDVHQQARSRPRQHQSQRRPERGKHQAFRKKLADETRLYPRPARRGCRSLFFARPSATAAGWPD